MRQIPREEIYRSFIWAAFGSGRNHRYGEFGQYPISESLTRALDEAVAALPDKYRKVLGLKWDFANGLERTDGEVASMITGMKTGRRVSQSYIWQMKCRGIRMVRHPRRSKKIKEQLGKMLDYLFDERYKHPRLYA